MRHLNGETSEERLGTLRGYARHDAGEGRIIFTRVQQRRLISLIDLVKDRTHPEEEL